MLFAADLNNGVKKESLSKEVTRIWVNEDIKVRSFSPTPVIIFHSFDILPLSLEMHGGLYLFLSWFLFGLVIIC